MPYNKAMTTSQQKSVLEYQQRVQKALTYIMANLDRPLSLKEIARAASFSEYHFHRIFSAVMEESPGEYVTRKKLEKAAIRLAYSPNATVSQVAFEFGYASVSSFSKAFNQWFGVRPSMINKIRDKLDAKGGKLQTRYEKSIETDELFIAPSGEAWYSRFKEIDRRVTVKTVSSFTLHYLTSPEGYDHAGIRNTWMELLERAEDARVDLSACERFAISHDHPGFTPIEKCRYDACLALPESHNQEIALAVTEVPAGRYAVFSVEGAETSILNQYLEFFTVWMPQSGYEPDNFPVLERYLPPYREGYLRVELWAKIKRLSCL